MTTSGMYSEAKVNEILETPAKLPSFIDSVDLGDFSNEEATIDISNAREGYVGTYSGKKFFPLDPDPDTVDIYDIAHALSLVCRWGGHIREHYSVAQHSVHVSKICKPEDALIGLLHDAAEAYIGDMVRPLKYLPVMKKVYSMIETKVNIAIAKHFGLPTIEKTESVNWADVVVLAHEAILLRQNSGWATESLNKLGNPPFSIVSCWSPGLAEEIWLERFNELTGQTW